jgi:2-polyprenyl-3-methyl-5-hydroxy-6-metoxy-1,4-benzoquinol methylase
VPESHRTLDQPIESVQSENRAWWTAHPMTYDWHSTIKAQPMTQPWFDEIDGRWISASFPYVSSVMPFDKIMPADLRGKRVLEIGCGMGLHTEQLVRRGAQVTAIDITTPAIDATRARLQIRGLRAVVEQADAEALPFGSASFDLVWSWGVIHHAARTALIVRQIARVLDASGEARIMVYNRDARITWLVLLRHYLMGRGYKSKSVDEVLWEHTDGYLARHYTVDGLDDMLRGFFRHSTTRILGQETDAVPLPARLRTRVAPIISSSRKEALAAKHGWFLFATAREPLKL